MRLVLEPAPLVPLSQRKGRFRKTAPIWILKPVLGVPEDLETFIFLMTQSFFGDAPGLGAGSAGRKFSVRPFTELDRISFQVKPG